MTLQTRPLSLKNCDNKLVVSANIRCLEPDYQNITHRIQNGFVKMRNFLNNILDLDSAGRIFSMFFESECHSSNPSNFPALMAYDFAAAFPSVIQAWIWLVLKHRKLPEHYVKFFQGIYYRASAIFEHGGNIYNLIDFLSGVLQGCPGSAFLFNNAIDPFLYCIDQALRAENRGIARACADDIGAVFRRLKHLELIHPIFVDANKFAGLSLKPSKCVLVLLCELSEKRVSDVRKWLKRNISEWADVQIAATTKFLGFYVGPKASSMQWTEQATKIRNRIGCIKASSAPMELNALTYNSRISPVVGYIGQLVPIPDNFLRKEHADLHSTLRLPQNSLCHADFFHLADVGGPKLRSYCVSAVSALIRTSLKTVSSWSDWMPQLRAAAEQFLPLNPLLRNKLSTPYWDSPPLAWNLEQASLGRPDHPQWADNLPEIVACAKVKFTAKCPLQKFIYSELMQVKFPNSLIDTISGRLTKLYQPYDLDFTNGVSLSVCFDELAKCPISVALKVTKTWCNGWATSKRYHNNEGRVLPCLFGCTNCLDDLAHYHQCPHLYAIWKFLSPLSRDNIVPIATPSEPLERWALMAPDLHKFRCIACVFSGYHAIRREFKTNNSFFAPNQNHLTGTQLRCAWSVFVNAFKVEARELRINTSVFSLPAFISFLNSSNEGVPERTVRDGRDRHDCLSHQT